MQTNAPVYYSWDWRHSLTVEDRSFQFYYSRTPVLELVIVRRCCFRLSGDTPRTMRVGLCNITDHAELRRLARIPASHWIPGLFQYAIEFELTWNLDGSLEDVRCRMNGDVSSLPISARIVFDHLAVWSISTIGSGRYMLQQNEARVAFVQFERRTDG